ncbi:hypothetical protein [Streptomyces sp. NRRL S-813]|uniref:hypothetical protein n=1 Tax=Streptomyces sp. NRRL S-813 TaxID=1463919 RepID=UPI0004C0DC66|nr:hypothetical protein [Streptomyces sp. NRRL S-813]
MLALRLTRVAHPAVQLRRLTVAAASAGTGFLLLSSLAYALRHPDDPSAALLRLSWCAVPLAATAYLAVAVARTDPGTRPRSALSALGLGPGRLMAVSAATTALACSFGALLALLVFLQLRGGGLADLPFDGAASHFLAADKPLPVPGTLILLAIVPALASAAVALALRPRETKPPARVREAKRGATEPARSAKVQADAGGSPAEGTGAPSGVLLEDAPEPEDDPEPGEADPQRPLPPRRPPTGLPWGIAVLAAGLAVEAYAGRTPASSGASTTALPGGLAADSTPVLVGWLLTALGLALAGPGLTHLCGRLLQAAGPGAVRLLAGRILMEEAGRIGRPLGVVCAVASGTYAMGVLYEGSTPVLGPLTALGTLLVAGCTVATLLTAAVEARQARADVTAALLRLGAPATTLRSAAALRAGVLLAVFVPLTFLIADLAALPLTR